MSDLQRYPCLNIKFQFLLFLKANYFICGFSNKINCAFFASETIEYFEARKTKLSIFHIIKQIKISRVPLRIGLVYLLIEDDLTLQQQSI